MTNKGQSVAEYGIILALAGVVCIASLNLLGNSISGQLWGLANSLERSSNMTVAAVGSPVINQAGNNETQTNKTDDTGSTSSSTKTSGNNNTIDNNSNGSGSTLGSTQTTNKKKSSNSNKKTSNASGAGTSGAATSSSGVAMYSGAGTSGLAKTSTTKTTVTKKTTDSKRIASPSKKTDTANDGSSEGSVKHCSACGVEATFGF